MTAARMKTRSGLQFCANVAALKASLASQRKARSVDSLPTQVVQDDGRKGARHGKRSSRSFRVALVGWLDVPNRSLSIANRRAKNVSAIGMKICPPSASRA